MPRRDADGPVGAEDAPVAHTRAVDGDQITRPSAQAPDGAAAAGIEVAVAAPHFTTPTTVEADLDGRITAV